MADSDYPVKIIPCCTSVVSDLQEEHKALHESIEIKCFYEGNSTLLIGEELLAVNAGDVVVINPYAFHATVNCGEKQGKYHLFMIPLEFFSRYGAGETDLQRALLTEGYAFRSLYPNRTDLVQLCHRIVEEYTGKPTAYTLAISGLFMELMALLLRDGLVTGSNVHPGNLRAFRGIEPALRYMWDHYTAQITVDHLATLCNMSKYHFCRTFKNATKQTAMGYLREYRLKIADMLLLNTGKTVLQIAADCGFGDENYFCSSYKKHFGISPGKRRKNRNDGYEN